MRCSKVRKLMFKFFEEDLTEKEMVQINEHLKDCPWCMSEYKKAKKVLDCIQSETPKIVPEGLHKNIMIDINGMNNFIQTERKETRKTFKIAVRRVAATCLAVFIAIYALTFVNFDLLKSNIQNGFTKLASFDKEESVRDEDDIFYDIASLGRTASKEKASDEESEMAEASYQTTGALNTNDLAMTTLLNTNEGIEETKEVNYYTTDDYVASKGFLTTKNYSEYLDNDDNVTKKSMLELYTLNFDKAVDGTNDVANKYNANIYYSNISYNDNGDGYRTGIIALRVVRDNYNKLINEIEKLGTYDLNVLQDELKIETSEDLNVLLIHCKDKKIELESELENLNKDSDTYEEDKASLQEQIVAQDESIENIEASLEKMKANIEIIKLELTVKECSELELEGILSGKTFGLAFIKSLKKGWKKFVRMLQNFFLWLGENILFIIFFVLVFSLVFFILKAIFLRIDE